MTTRNFTADPTHPLSVERLARFRNSIPSFGTTLTRDERADLIDEYGLENEGDQ